MKNLLIFLLMALHFKSYSSESSTIRLMKITSQDIIAIEEINLPGRKEFDENGGYFQIFTHAKSFVFKAPNCKKNIKLRLWPVSPYLKDPQRQEHLDRHWELLQIVYAVASSKVESITVPVSAKPYMKLNKNGEPILEYCNAFIPRDFWKYSPDHNESNTLEKPVEQQNAPLELENK